jgi:glutaredoxin
MRGIGMNKTILVVTSVLALFLAGINASAGECHYTDRNGDVHFVNDISQVPPEYRHQATNAASLPDASIVGRPGPARSERLRDPVPPDRPERRKQSFDGTVEVFMTSWCGYCKKLTAFLDSKGIRYKTFDIEKDGAASRTYKELGGRGVPLSRIGGVLVSGYNTDAILKTIEDQQ